MEKFPHAPCIDFVTFISSKNENYSLYIFGVVLFAMWQQNESRPGVCEAATSVRQQRARKKKEKIEGAHEAQGETALVNCIITLKTKSKCPAWNQCHRSTVCPSMEVSLHTHCSMVSRTFSASMCAIKRKLPISVPPQSSVRPSHFRSGKIASSAHNVIWLRWRIFSITMIICWVLGCDKICQFSRCPLVTRARFTRAASCQSSAFYSFGKQNTLATRRQNCNGLIVAGIRAVNATGVCVWVCVCVHFSSMFVCSWGELMACIIVMVQ